MSRRLLGPNFQLEASCLPTPHTYVQKGFYSQCKHHSGRHEGKIESEYSGYVIMMIRIPTMAAIVSLITLCDETNTGALTEFDESFIESKYSNYTKIK